MQTTIISVRYAETDQMGIVHHSSYALYLEEARIRHLENIGLPYHILEKNGTLLPVVEMNIKYLKPVKFGENITINTRFSLISKLKIKIDYDLHNENVLVSDAYTIHVCLNKMGKPVKPSKDFIEQITRL